MAKKVDKRTLDYKESVKHPKSNPLDEVFGIWKDHIIRPLLTPGEIVGLAANFMSEDQRMLSHLVDLVGVLLYYNDYLTGKVEEPTKNLRKPADRELIEGLIKTAELLYDKKTPDL